MATRDSDTATLLDPQDYLDRIAFPMRLDGGSPTPSLHLLQALHEAHMLAVPFENLSIHYGQPIILEEAALYAKIVRRNRGGFCYELNGMFAWLLRQLGYDVTLLSAEVASSDGGYTPAFDHLTLLTRQVDGVDRLADVGFGDSFRKPLRFQTDIEQDGGDGRIYRLRESSCYDDSSDASDDCVEPSRRPYWIVEQRGNSQGGDQWEPQYRFTLQPHALVDFNERCLYQQTSPDSHFKQKRVCSLALPHGRVTLSDLRLITTLDGRRDEREVASEQEYRALLAEQFGVVL